MLLFLPERHPNVLNIETNIQKLDKMEFDNVQHENELAEHTTNESEDIPMNQEHLKSNKDYFKN